MKYNVLLLEDVTNQGRKGDLVEVAPGFARNFLLPKGKALLASRSTINLRTRLQKERGEQSEIDKVKSAKLATELKGKMFEITVKVDPDGHMYGSVTTNDIVDLMIAQGVDITKKSIALAHPIRQIGNHVVMLKLPEGVDASVGLEVKPDREIKKKVVAKKPMSEDEAQATSDGANDEAAAEGETPLAEEAKETNPE